MREVSIPDTDHPLDAASFLACLATVLELPFEQLPALPPGEDPATGWTISRWLGGRGLGIARIADPSSFSWPRPWIVRVGAPAPDAARAGPPTPRFVVMYGVPSGVVWDPVGPEEVDPRSLTDGLLVAAADIAQGLPPRPPAPASIGTVDGMAAYHSSS
jgi:hypothetical protein